MSTQRTANTDPPSDVVEKTGSSDRGGAWQVVKDLLGRYTIQWVVLALFVVLLLTNDSFGSLTNIQNVLRQASFVGITAAAMTLLIISGAFDLSVAGILTLCAITAGTLLPSAGLPVAILAAVVVGVVLGLVNGVVVAKVRIPAFVATLGTLYIYQAASFIWTNDQVVIISDPFFLAIGAGSLFGVPTPFLVMGFSYLVCYGILRFTRYGRFMRAIGSNEQASEVTGIPVDRVRIFTFVLVGLFTAVAGITLAALLSSANGTMATGYELNVIAVVVVGGTSLFGGRGTLLGTFTGAIFFAILNNALNLYGIGAYWQYVAVGLVLITALGVEGVRRRFVGPGG